MDWTGCVDIEVNPGKLSGKPAVAGSRVFAQQIVDSAEAGESPQKIAYSFELPVEQVRAILSFAASRSLLKPTA